jgi:hypothetical protein
MQLRYHVSMHADLHKSSVASSLAAILSNSRPVAFAPQEYQVVITFLDKKYRDPLRKRFAYDLKSVAAGEYVRGVIRIASKNFGYEFLLIKAAARGAGAPDSASLQMFRSVLGEDNYVSLTPPLDVAAALEAIDRMYCQAAKAHLP